MFPRVNIHIAQMSQLQSQLQGLPGYDILSGLWDDYAGEHFNSMDPFVDEDGNKRKLPKEYSTSQEQRIWKNVQKQAWTHDKCLLGSCGVGLDCGCGLVPFAVLFFPVLGPLVMYALHSKIIDTVTNEIKLPDKLVAKMHGQIVFDLIITFPPLIGCFFGWVNLCLTRNAGMIYKYLLFLSEERKNNNHAIYIGRGAIGQSNNVPEADYPGNPRVNNYSNPRPKKNNSQNSQNFTVSNQQQSGFV